MATRAGHRVTQYKDPERGVFGFYIAREAEERLDLPIQPLPEGVTVAGMREAPPEPSVEGMDLVVWMMFGAELTPDIAAAEELVQFQSFLQDVPDALVWGRPLEFYLVSYAAADEGKSVILKMADSVPEAEQQRITQWVLSGAVPNAASIWPINLGIEKGPREESLED